MEFWTSRNLGVSLGIGLGWGKTGLGEIESNELFPHNCGKQKGVTILISQQKRLVKVDYRFLTINVQVDNSFIFFWIRKLVDFLTRSLAKSFTHVSYSENNKTTPPEILTQLGKAVVQEIIL